MKSYFADSIKVFIISAIIIITTNISAERKCISVFLSANLRPYWEVAYGIRDSLKEFEVKIIEPEYINDETESCPIKVAVGLKALKTVSSFKGIKVFSLILYPWMFKETENFQCGVYLEIPPDMYIEALKKEASWVRDVAILYSNSTLERYISDIKNKGEEMGLFIRKIKVNSLESLKKKLNNIWMECDALILIPDPIFSTEAVIKMIARSALKHKKVIVGYNRFFLDIGAAISIVTDYKLTGVETAKMVKDAIKGKCTWKTAVHKIEINKKLLEKISCHESE